jgi:hypothetical protein
MSNTVVLRLEARRAEPVLPPSLRPASRSAAAGDDPFLPAGYLIPKAAFELGASSRAGVAGPVAQRHEAAPDDVLVLELSDGGTFVTSAARLKDALALSRPELIGADGEIRFELLREPGSAARSGLGSAIGLVAKVFALALGGDDSILDAAREWLREKTGSAADIGVSWLGTQALMWAIEQRLQRPAGLLYPWQGEAAGAIAAQPADPQQLAAMAAAQRPMLVFIHGTGSCSMGSFGDLQCGNGDIWTALDRQYSGGIYAFEHRTLSESPIDNALQLVNALPAGAQVSLVSHSRGGLVADLLCLADFDALIDGYAFALEGTGDADAAEAARVIAELAGAHAAQREQLRALAKALRDKQLVVQRYVRVAAPAMGTRLASGNLDLFLSGLLTLIGQVPFFFGSPFYAAFKRVVLEIARNRTNAHLVPGIEAMLPDSPMARLLRDAPVRPGIALGLIAGDTQGGPLFKRLGLLLTDFLLFDTIDNDLVVDTPSMLAGIAPRCEARVLFDRGATVSHFNYFSNADTRQALRDWLVLPQVECAAGFVAWPGSFAELEAQQAALAATTRRDASGRTAPDLPIVVVLPGIMGSHLQVDRRDRVWFDPLDLATGGLAKIAWGQPGVEAEALMATLYGALCEHLAGSHRVETFPYDWRQPLDVLGERLGELLDRLLKETNQPIRLLAHSMGGLVIRACIHSRRTVMDTLMARDGARLVMLGTPNQGAHSMVQNLIGKDETVRTLAAVDVQHDLQQILDFVASFRGALQLLPKPGFTDTFQGEADGGQAFAYQQAATWAGFKPDNPDRWFGNGRVGVPLQAALDAGSWLWSQDGLGQPSLPAAYENESAYVFGIAPNTPCGLRREGTPGQGARLRLVGTSRGDGTVSWDSGRIGGIGSFYYLPAKHGDLAATPAYFQALSELLCAGATRGLPTSPPAQRDVEQARPVVYDAGPPVLDADVALARGLMGGPPRSRVAPRPQRRLEVAVKAMDLRFLSEPILVGHYEQDAIAGPQSLIDTELLTGDLSERHSLGLYAGPLGSASVVLRIPNEQERRRGSLSGAVVCGLGPYDGALTPSQLTQAVRAGVLRYLLQIVDVLGKADREVPLATLLLGYNSSAHLSVGASVEALVRGVLEANSRFHATTRLNIRVSRLDIVELYLDTAITAVYELRQMAPALAVRAERCGALLNCVCELEQGEGLRQRLFDNRGSSYWPRLMITDADPSEDRGGLADTLRFLYVGQRARAESVVQQRQPGLIEALVRQQIHSTVWQEDIGRMLFQLLVPHDFKDAARQLQRVVLVVDATTANLPWELMLPDDPDGSGDKLPLALRAPAVRQLASSGFRPQVRQALDRSALVIGNPSVAGFGKAFSLPADPPPLTGAQAEADAVVSVLSGMGYQVAQAIGDDRSASDVLAWLYRQPYRVLHISAHGVFDQRHVDGRRRSGVVLSDGLLITAAEIGAMEIVPEFVFLNCCHLGQLDALVRDGNKLAASVARELIQIGVRCVVVAGWAVNDELARLFGETLYGALLRERLPFGEAVFKARQALWAENREDITWGAFQAYGDAGWLAEPAADRSGATASAGPFVSPEELLDELARLRADLSRRKERQTDREIAERVKAIERVLRERCPAGWSRLPTLQSALAATWADLNCFDEARKAYLGAVQAEDRQGRVPIRDIEQLANIEARLGERRNEPALITLALRRLDGLDALVFGPDQPGSRPAVSPVSAERAALRGSAYKRRASLESRQLLRDDLPADERRRHAAALVEALTEAARAYASGEGLPGSPSFRAYNALNRLALQAVVLPRADDTERDAAVLLAQRSGQAAALAHAASHSVWDAVMEPEALLIERLLDGSLALDGPEGDAAAQAVAQAYADTLSNLTIKPKDLDSVVSQMGLLSRFADALVRSRPDGDGLSRMADRLIALANGIAPGAVRRDGPRPRPLPPPRAASRKRSTRKKP